MMLLTKENLRKLPPIYAQQNEGDPIIYVKFFTPWSNWTWYAMEYDPEERMFFGIVEGLETEFGYFSLDEIAEVRGPFGLKIERDRHFKPSPVSKVRGLEKLVREPKTPEN